MTLQLPYSVSIIFGVSAILSGFFIYKASHFDTKTGIFLLLYVLFQGILGFFHFYEEIEAIPPRFPLLLVPAFVVIGLIFFTQKGKKYIDSLDVSTLTILHIVRIPVEIGLFWLYIHKAIPQLMTFEGRNVDILAGISAPIIYYLFFVKKKINERILLIWNVICLLFLANIVIHAILSTPTFVQQFAFEQPNIAIFYFPFHLLPSFIVPVVLFAHLVAIKKYLENDFFTENKA